MDDSPKLPVAVAQQFVDVANTLCISRISLLEIAIKAQFAKDNFPLDFEQWLERFQQFDFEMLEITDAHLVTLSQLPTVKDHRDPFDRLLIAQALTDDLTLISRDGNKPLRHQPIADASDVENGQVRVVAQVLAQA